MSNGCGLVCEWFHTLQHGEMATFRLITGCETSLISSPGYPETAGTRHSSAGTPIMFKQWHWWFTFPRTQQTEVQPPRQEMANESRRHGLAVGTTSPELDVRWRFSLWVIHVWLVNYFHFPQDRRVIEARTKSLVLLIFIARTST